MKKYFQLLASLFLALPLMAERAEYSFFQVSLDDGLSQPNVLALMSDRRGSLWIGTANGLNRFDNQVIKTYSSTGKDDASLPDSRIEGIAEDTDGRIWIMTRFGLALYSPDGDSFETIFRNPAWCSLVLGDRTFFGGEGCILQMMRGSERIEKIPLFDSTSAHRIARLSLLNDGRIIMGTRDSGLYVYDMDQKKAVRFTESVHPHLISIYPAGDGTVYAAFYGDGFYRYGSDGKELAHFTAGNSGLSNDFVQDFQEYDDVLWVATDGGGINRFNPEDNSFDNIIHYDGDSDGLPSNSITVLYEDSMGNFWAGSVKKGFFQIKRNHIHTLKGSSSGLVDDAVSSMYRDRDGVLWVGTDGGGLHRLDPASGKCIPYPTTSGTKVISIAGMGKDKLVLSLFTKGIFIFDKQTGNLSPFTVVDDDVNQRFCFSGYLPRIGEVSDGKLFFLSDSAWIYDICTRSFSPMPKESDSLAVDGMRMPYSDSRISLFYKEESEMSDGAVLVASHPGDTLRFLFSAGEGAISSIASDGAGSIWVGTDRGLGRYDMMTKEYSAVPTSLFKNVTALAADGMGRLWICADNRLFTYLPEGRFASWNKSDGFPPNNIKMMYQNALDDAFIYFGGSDGLVRIDRDIPIPGKMAPHIFLERLSVNGRPVTDIRQGDTLKVKLKNFNSLRASFLTRNKDVFQRKLYRYTVNGRRGSNSIETFEPRFYLPGLHSGDYELLVSCLTKDGTFSEPQKMLSLIITPPWYKTGWFFGSLAVLAATAAAVIAYMTWKKREKADKKSMARFLEGVLYSSDVKDDKAASTQPSSGKSEFLSRFEKIVRDNLTNPDLGVQLMCKEILMSRTSLYNRLKKETGMGVNDYINRIRIERSVELLLNTDLSISEISYEVGFSYPRYFSTSFKNIKGMTPTRFKQENKDKLSTDNPPV